MPARKRDGDMPPLSTYTPAPWGRSPNLQPPLSGNRSQDARLISIPSGRSSAPQSSINSSHSRDGAVNPVPSERSPEPQLSSSSSLSRSGTTFSVPSVPMSDAPPYPFGEGPANWTLDHGWDDPLHAPPMYEVPPKAMAAVQLDRGVVSLAS